jgi:hypothetical protein
MRMSLPAVGDGGRIREIERERRRGNAGVGERAHRRVGGVAVATIGQGDARAAGAESRADGASEPAAAAGYERTAVGKLWVRLAHRSKSPLAEPARSVTGRSCPGAATNGTCSSALGRRAGFGAAMAIRTAKLKVQLDRRLARAGDPEARSDERSAQ